ncbi:MAG: hypothetical protein KW788_02960, partial [Candidatus Doudnabacteria bacterium]|nr:hypothetical protein [Candidatus Doudnabacteria bacterium]
MAENESKFGGQFEDAFKDFLHKEKAETNPEYAGDNPSTKDQILKDLTEFGIVKDKDPIKDLYAEGIALGILPINMDGKNLNDLSMLVLERKARALGIPTKDIKKADTVHKLKLRIDQRTRKNNLVYTDRIEEALEGVASPEEIKKYAEKNSESLRPEHKKVAADMSSPGREQAVTGSRWSKDREPQEEPEVQTVGPKIVPRTAESAPLNMKDIDRSRARGKRVGAKFDVRSTKQEIEQAIYEVERKFKQIALKINPNQDTSDLSAAQLKEYIDLAAEGRIYAGKTFGEVSKTKEYKDSFFAARERQRKDEETWTNSAKVKTSEPTVEPTTKPASGPIIADPKPQTETLSKLDVPPTNQVKAEAGASRIQHVDGTLDDYDAKEYAQKYGGSQRKNGNGFDLDPGSNAELYENYKRTERAKKNPVNRSEPSITATARTAGFGHPMAPGEFTNEVAQAQTQVEAPAVTTIPETQATPELPATAAMTEREAQDIMLGQEAPPIPPKSEIRPEPVHETLNINGRVIDVSRIVEQYANRMADEKTRELLESKGMLTKWAFRMAEEGWRLWYRKKAVEDITKSKNLGTLIERRMLGWTDRVRKLKFGEEHYVVEGDENINYEILDEVIKSYEKDFVDADEKGEIVKDPEINSALAELFYKNAKGGFKSRKEFEAAVMDSKIYDKLHGKKFTKDETREKEKMGLLYADNFWQLAESYKDRISAIIEEQVSKGEDEQSVRNYLNGIMNVDLQLGLAQRDLRNNMPEGKLTRAQKWFVENTESIPVLNKAIANPLGYAVFGSVLGQGAAKGLVRAGLLTGTAVFFAPTTAALLAGGLASGMFMYARRGRDLKHDRGMDLRRQALGEQSGGKRTDKIREAGGYDFASAEELAAKLDGIQAKGSASEDDRKFVANVLARLNFLP